MSSSATGRNPEHDITYYDLTTEDGRTVKSERLSRKSLLRQISRIPEPAGSAWPPAFQDSDTEEESCALYTLQTETPFLDEETKTAPEGRLHTDRDILRWAVCVLSESPQAHALLTRAAQDGWHVGLDSLNTGGFYLDVPTRTLWLDHFGLKSQALARSSHFRSALIVTFARALRDIWHEREWSKTENRYRPEGLVLLERARAADTDTLATLIAWELRGAGYPDIWRFLLGSGEGDIAMVFAGKLESDPGTLYNGAALAAAFRQWYADPLRVDAADHDSLNRLDELLNTLTDEGHLPPFGKESLKESAVETLSVLPSGARYLCGHARSIATEPVFAGLNDPVNQAHLFQIVYDTQAVIAEGVPFRSAALAKKIFPDTQ